MHKYNAENERVKKWYRAYLKDAQGQDEKTLDKVTAALAKFEESTKYKPFKMFQIKQAVQFKST